LQFPLKIMDDLIHVECKLIEAGNLKVNKIWDCQEWLPIL
jgi:hypothetical protein